MKVKASYTIELHHSHKALHETVNYYRKCVKRLIGVSLAEYDNFKNLKFSNEKQSYIEKLVHSTKSRKAKYQFFDKEFYKFPSYLRRTAITEANGIVESYKAQLKAWDGTGKKPRLVRNHKVMPSLFKDNMFKDNDDGTCQIKIYRDNDWVWHTFTMRKTDVHYIRKNCVGLKESAPTLEKRGHKYVIRFLYTFDSELSKHTDTICAVDLGINTDAVCSIMAEDGTVVVRKFINHATEKDRLNTILGQIKKAQKNGNKHTDRLWRFANNYNTEISKKTAHDIILFAESHNVQTIVLEYLDPQGKVYGSKKQRLALWRKREVQGRIMALAHRHGMRVNRVSEKNTSKLAFDGSGEVKRNPKNHSLCTFSSGKQYNCDLSASYNIGARYFLRERFKTLSEKARLELAAKDPQVFTRTESGVEYHATYGTLSTLISFNAVLTAFGM